MSLSANIAKERENRGISQQELAEKTGVHQSHISHIEKGLKMPNVLMLVKIADVLNCSIDGLLDRNTDQ